MLGPVLIHPVLLVDVSDGPRGGDPVREGTGAAQALLNEVPRKLMGDLRRTASMRSSLCSIAPPRTESYVSRAMSL